MLVAGVQVDSVLWASLRSCQQEGIKTGLTYTKTTDYNRSCLISLPTGAGKSGVICVLAHIVNRRRILVLCHRRSVCDQLISQLKGTFFSKISSEISIDLKAVQSSIDDLESEGVYVTTFQKLQTLEASELAKLKEEVDLLLIDEGHSEPSPIWSKLARGLDSQKIIITATPYRNDLFQFDIDPLNSYIYTFEKALNDHILQNPTFSTIQSVDLNAEIQKLLKAQPGTKCIIKCKTFQDVQRYHDELADKYKTLGIHEKFSGDSRNNVTAHVPKNLGGSDWEVLVHQKKLDEGVDIPEAKVLVLTYPVASGRELVQTVGRVVRKCNDFSAHVIEIEKISNRKMWENYREFDSYLSLNGAAKKFLASLDTAKLIDTYLESFPDISYFDSGFKKKFNFSTFDAKRSLSIPLASVCFIKKSALFTIESLMDKIFWQFTKDGELVKQLNDQYGCEVIASITFNNSKFLKDQLFFQPSLEIFLAKDIGSYVAIYDSRSRNFTSEPDLGLGVAVKVDNLLKLACRSERARTKEAHTSAISTAEKRPESVSIRGHDLDRMATPQSNSAYALTTLKVDNLGRDDKKISSYYLGVGSGRVSDQKKRNFLLEELSAWIDDVGEVLNSGTLNTSGLVNSYAKPITEIPDVDPVSIVIDLSSFDSDIIVNVNNKNEVLENNFMYINYENGISLFHDFKYTIKYDKKLELLQFETSDKYESIGAAFTFNGNHYSENLLKLLNEVPLKVLYPDGISYFSGHFYRVTLPSEIGIKLKDSKLNGSIIALPCLLGEGLDEKDEKNTIVDSFGTNSIFHLIDMLRNVGKTAVRMDELGEFHKYIPDVDLILCTDMGTEPADFILSSNQKLVFVHVKCGKSSRQPESSAGAFAEVGGQAIKNLEMLISNSRIKPDNWTRLQQAWPTKDAIYKLEERLRLFSGTFFINKKIDIQVRKDALNAAWAVVEERRKLPSIQKEIWIVVGNGFSKSHFEKQIDKGHDAFGESLQAFQLIDSWMSTCANSDVSLKIFVSP